MNRSLKLLNTAVTAVFLCSPIQSFSAEAAEDCCDCNLPEGIQVHQDIENGQLVSFGLDGKLVYKPYTDKGDRIMDYSFCGYRASAEPIPDVPTVIELEPLPDTPAPIRRELPASQPERFLAYPEGPDSHARIQAALDAVAAMPLNRDGFRGTVLLKRGAYYLYDGLTIGPGVVLRGEGDDWGGTVLVFHHPGGTGISLKGAPEEKPWTRSPHSARIADDYVPVASNSLTVDSLGSFAVGDPVQVIKTPNQDWVDTLDMNPPGKGPAGGGNKPWTPEGYKTLHPRIITKIEGKQLFFNVPLPQSIVEKHGGGTVVQDPDRRPIAGRGLERLRIVSNYNRSVRTSERSRDGEIYEADQGDNLSNAVSVGAANAWVRNCTMMHQIKSAVGVGGGALFVTIRDCTSLEPVSLRRGGLRYCFSLNTGASMVLIYNCFAEHGRHSFVSGKKVMGPNAFVRCHQTHGNMEAHHRWATGLLFDLSTNTSIWGAALQNRGGMGSGHGWAGANGVIWNYVGGVMVANPQTPEQNFAIGCIVPDYAKHSAGVRGDGYIWSEGSHVSPESLFEAQLIDRLGAEQAESVLAK